MYGLFTFSAVCLPFFLLFLSRYVSKIIRFPVIDANIEIHDGFDTLLVEFVSIPPTVEAIPGRNSEAKYEAIFEAREIPPIGFRTYYVRNTGKKRINFT